MTVTADFVELNRDKMKVFRVVPKSQIKKMCSYLSHMKETLGIILFSDVSFDNYINEVTRAPFHNIKIYQKLENSYCKLRNVQKRSYRAG